jgi:two-component system, cell cycle response regulator DivK
MRWRSRENPLRLSNAVPKQHRMELTCYFLRQAWRKYAQCSLGGGNLLWHVDLGALPKSRVKYEASTPMPIFRKKSGGDCLRDCPAGIGHRRDPLILGSFALQTSTESTRQRPNRSESLGRQRRRTMEKILIVDDDRASRDLIRAILKSVRCEIIEASHGQQALELLQQERPDLVLLDIDMPGLDGLAVVKKIRQDATFAHLSVVAVTAYAMEGDGEKCMAAGFTAYLTKPVRAATLRQQVQQLLSARA